MSIYTVEQPISSLDTDEVPGEPYKVLIIARPPEGNYILKIYGTGDGPYTIDIGGTTSDGTDNLSTSFTGTATPSLLQTYRVTYSPTGEASLSQTNQAPVTNAGSNQTGEQSYDITLDGSASHDPDGDPMTYTWSFLSKPNGSGAALSDSHAIKPTFTPDLPGMYTLQLIVNDHFVDSASSTVTITVTPLKSRISVTPNFSQSLSGNISFDVTNTGRIAVTAGAITISLADPTGAVIYSGSQLFSIGVGGSATVSVPATIPSSKFGNYTLTYTQSDETKTGTPVTVTVPNSSLITFSFDKTIYRVRDTANLTLNLINTGKFNLDGATVTVSVPDAGYTNSQGVSISQGQTLPVQYVIQIPSGVIAGQHSVNATLTLPSGSTIMQSARFTLQDSTLVLDTAALTQYATGGVVTLTVENQGSVDTTYATQKLTLTDANGNVLYQGSVTDAIIAGEIKTLANVQIPAQFTGNMALLSVTLQDTKTGKLSYLNTSLSINGLQAGLLARTDKDVYMNTETVAAISTVTNSAFNIENGALDIKVNRYKKSGGTFTQFLPKKGWYPFSSAYGVAIASNGAIFVTENPANGEHHVLKFDNQGNFISKWGSTGTGNGQFNNPGGIAAAPDGSVYVVDSGNNRIQKFDSNGNFITTWGGYGTGNGQFNSPWGIVVAADGSVYVSDAYNHRVQKFDANGSFISKWGSYGSGNGQFVWPMGIAVDSAGSLFVVDNYTYKVQKFDSNGLFQSSWSGLNHPVGISVDQNGFVYVVDTWNHRIQKSDNNGQFVSTWGNYGSGNGQFGDYLYDVAVGPDGFVYVTEASRVQKFDSNGNFISSWGKTGSEDGWFNVPSGIAVNANEYLFVIEYGNNRVQKFDKDGNFVAKWGSYGSGIGQFSSPKGIAVAADGALYLADTGNNRIQKFDSNGNFISKWGSYGSGNGQFSQPNDVAVGPDGAVYVADTYNNRIQEFDGNGNFIRSWGGFNQPSGIAAAADGSVYVADTGNNRIQKLDSNGNFILTWGSYGSGNGQFNRPTSVMAGPDGTVYVADSGNNRVQKFNTTNGSFIATWGGLGSADGEFYQPTGIAMGPSGSVYITEFGNSRIQRMLPMVTNSETLFETNIPVTQPAGTTQDYTTNVGVLNATGKLYLEATLKNSLGQTIADSEYPFYIVNGNAVLSFSTDKKAYKPGDTVTINGEVRNLAATTASGLSLLLNRQDSTGSNQKLYSTTIDVLANGSYPFTITTTAVATGSYVLTGNVLQNTVTLAAITDQYTVTTPAVSATITGPDIVNRNPFGLTVQLANTGIIDANIQYIAVNSQGTPLDVQQITIPAGQTRLFTYSQQIMQNTIYTVSLSGDVTQTTTKTVIYGEAAVITLGQASGVYPEGTVSFPVTVTNTGLLDESVSVTYSLSPSASNQTMTYYLPKGGSITDTITFNLTAGNYQFLASSLLPTASTSASFAVVKDPSAAMTTTAGVQGTNGLVPVTVNVANSGYNDLNGSITVAVMDNFGKAVWRGEGQVSSLKSQVAANYVINVVSTGLLPGAYSTSITLYNAAGQQLAANQTQVRVLGPIFEITAVPTNLSFTVGNQAALTFGVKNTGTLAGSASLSVAAANLINQSASNSFQPGEQKYYTFNFTVPEIESAGSYSASYSLSSSNSQGTTGQTVFNITGVNVGMTATLDKQVYNNGDTAVLNLTVAKQSQFDDGTYLAIIRYGSYNAVQPVTISSQPATLTFNVPLNTITGNRLFYGVYFQSGTKISQSSLHINTPPVVIAVSPTANGIYNSMISISAVVSDGGLGISTVQYQVDNGAWLSLPLTDPSQGLYSTIWTPTYADNGSHTVNFKATDTAGNTGLSTPLAFVLSMDITPPIGSIVINNGAQYVNNIAVSLTLDCADTESGCSRMQFSNDNATWSAPEPYTPAKTWPLPSGDGPKTVYVKYLDGVGNISVAYSAVVILDTIPPITTATPVGGLYNWAKSVVLAANEPATIYYTTDGTAPSKASVLYSGPITITSTMTLNFFGVDLAGNTETVKSATYTIDTQDPTLTLSMLPDGSYTNNPTLNIAGKAIDNIAVQGVTINDTAITINVDGTFSEVITLATGSNTITTVATDTAGNLTKDVRTITLDQTLPVITITNPADNSVTNVVGPTVTGVVDKTATVTVKVNNGNTVSADMTGNSFSLPVTFVYGQNTIEVTATDLATNTSTAKRTVTFDNINPSLAITNPAQDLTTNQPGILLQGTVADLTDTAVTVTMDGIISAPSVTGGTFQQTLTFSEEKTYSIIVTATDAAGNITTVRRNIIYQKAQAALTYTGATFIAEGRATNLSGVLKGDGVSSSDLSGKTVTFTLGGSSSQSCTGTTDADGNVSCTIGSVTVPLGPTMVTATFTGDAYFQPSSSSKSVIVFAFPSSGSFVIGDKTAGVNNSVTFWGAQWSKTNPVSGGAPPVSFKGFADSMSDTPPGCGGTWTTPGNSSSPPNSVPAYMAVIVSSSITNSGSAILGDITEFVIVKTNGDYGPAPGQTGTGTVVGVLSCK